MPNDAVLPAFPVFTGINAAGAYQLAASMVAQAEAFSDALTAEAAALVAPTVTPNFPTVASAPIPAVTTAPTLQQVTWNVPTEPTAFTGTVGNISGYLPGPFTGVAPTLNFPGAPGAPPTTALVMQLMTDLSNVIATGQGTFLPTQAQQALMDAAYEREYRTVANAIAELERQESLGYMFPTGSFLDARTKIQTELNYTMSGISRDIFAKQMDVQLENLMKCRALVIELEKALVEIYKSEVEAYKAVVEAQGVIEDVYKTQVEAFTAQVQAGAVEIQAVVDIFKANIAAYQAQLSGYDSAVRGMVGQATAASEYNQAQAAVYSAAVQALKSYNDVLVSEWQAVLNESEKIAEVGVAAAKANGDLYLTTRQLSQDAAKVGAQVSAQIAAAGLGAVHWSTALGVSVSASNTSSDSTVESAST